MISDNLQRVLVAVPCIIRDMPDESATKLECVKCRCAVWVSDAALEAADGDVAIVCLACASPETSIAFATLMQRDKMRGVH